MTKRSGQRVVKSGANGTTRTVNLANPSNGELHGKRRVEERAGKATPSSGSNTEGGDFLRAPIIEPADVAAELSRMIAELNEVRMRVDAIVRKLAQSAVEMPSSSGETVDDVERLRMRLVGKLDRIRDQLVTRLGEERVSRDR